MSHKVPRALWVRLVIYLALGHLFAAFVWLRLVHDFTPAVEETVQELARLSVQRLASPAPLGGTVDAERLDAVAGKTITAAGLGGAEVVRLWTEVLAPARIAVDHPRYLSFVPGAPTKLAAAFDMLVGVSGIYGGSWLEGAGAAQLPVLGVDIVEVSPPYDHAEITSFLANRVVLETPTGIARRRKDARDGTTWDPRQPLLDCR
ncbi:DUF6126 family protein [Streptomyces sp. NPDC047725]|uniref:DUF6126 family protein n=1 Tax=Streptomyces sp. NPDC047725 TaxID=3365487 RepID=UPI003718C7E4